MKAHLSVSGNMVNIGMNLKWKSYDVVQRIKVASIRRTRIVSPITALVTQ